MGCNTLLSFPRTDVDLSAEWPREPREVSVAIAASPVVSTCVVADVPQVERMWIDPSRLRIDATVCVALLIDDGVICETTETEAAATLRACHPDVSDIHNLKKPQWLHSQMT